MVLRRPLLAAALALALAPLAAGAEDVAAAGPASAEATASAASAGDLVDGIAAQVGTEVVLISDVAQLAQPLEEKMREQGATDTDVIMMRSEVLDRLIDRRLVSLFAKRNEVEATEPEIEDAIGAVARENQLTLEQLRQSVEAQGLGWDAYRERLAEEIVQQKILGGAVRARVRVEDAEVRELYDERFANQPTSGTDFHLQEIAVGARDDKPASKKAACDRVRAAYARVRAGEDFLAVAREASEAPPDLGWVHESSLSPWMGGQVGNLQPGQTSGVIELPIGCAVLRLVDRREARAVSFEEARDSLRAALFDERFEQEYEKFMERLRKQTYVDRKGPFARTGDGGATQFQ